LTNTFIFICRISGQTWLQLQQQKLRAKKEQQNRDHVDSFTRTSYGNNTLSYSDAGRHRTQTLSPVRNENRNYHTMTTTTKIEKTERPFVAVKRAYEDARQNKTYGVSTYFSSGINHIVKSHFSKGRKIISTFQTENSNYDFML
jgi:hypothetical protein